MSPKNFSDTAIVLKRINYGEADRILTLFTRANGKISAIAKGVRKITSRKAPHIELFSHAKLYFAVSHQLPIITQAETISDFAQLKNGLQRTKHAFHLLETLDQLLVEGQPHTEIFDHLIHDLHTLSVPNISLSTAEDILANFEIFLLEHLGFGSPAKIAKLSAGSPQLSPPDFLIVNAYIESVIDRQLTSLRKLS